MNSRWILTREIFVQWVQTRGGTYGDCLEKPWAVNHFYKQNPLQNNLRLNILNNLCKASTLAITKADPKKEIEQNWYISRQWYLCSWSHSLHIQCCRYNYKNLSCLHILHWYRSRGYCHHIRQCLNLKEKRWSISQFQQENDAANWSNLSISLPEQLNPSPLYPASQKQLYDPLVLVHVASSWHLSNFLVHSSISEGE